MYKVTHVLSYFDPKQLDEKDIPNLIYELSGAIWHDYQKKNSNNITYRLMSSPFSLIHFAHSRNWESGANLLSPQLRKAQLLKDHRYSFLVF